MTTGRRLFVCLTTLALVSTAAFADTPTVSDVVAKQRYPWNGKVDITCAIFESGTTAGEPVFQTAHGTPLFVLER